MVSIDDLNDAYKRINPYIVKTPIHISEALNKKCDSNIFLKEKLKRNYLIAGSIAIFGALLLSYESVFKNLLNTGSLPNHVLLPTSLLSNLTT